MIAYEVQGRRAADGVRLATEASVSAALAAAGGMAQDGFTAWVFETRRVERGRQYRLLDTIQPQDPHIGGARPASDRGESGTPLSIADAAALELLLQEVKRAAGTSAHRMQQ